MNILILVFSFLAVLAVTTASFWQTSSTVRMETSSFSGYMTANREADAALQKKLYRKLPTAGQKPPQGVKEKSSHRSSSTFSSHRMRNPPYQNGRLNIGILWKEDSHPYVEAVFERLLQELYGHTIWFKEANERGDVSALIASLLEFGRNKEGPILLHELFSSLSPVQAELFYKMVKGTHTYTQGNEKSGYPPLFDFINIGSGNAKEVCRFCMAPLPLLRALFDEKTVQAILTLEKEKWSADHKQHTCTKQELLTFLNSTSPTTSTHLETYFHFSRNSGTEKKISGKDQLTGIHVDKAL